MKCSSPGTKNKKNTPSQGHSFKLRSCPLNEMLRAMAWHTHHTCWGGAGPSCISSGVCRWCSAGSWALKSSACSGREGTLWGPWMFGKAKENQNRFNIHKYVCFSICSRFSICSERPVVHQSFCSNGFITVTILGTVLYNSTVTHLLGLLGHHEDQVKVVGAQRVFIQLVDID